MPNAHLCPNIFHFSFIIFHSNKIAAKKTDIQKWLASKNKDYDAGVKIYAEHPTAMRGLVNTLQRKQNKFTEGKLLYALEKAAEHDKSGKTAAIKKKEQPSKRKGPGKKSPAAPKKRKAKPKAVKKEAKQPATPPITEQPS